MIDDAANKPQPAPERRRQRGQTAAEALDPRRGQRLDQSRQAGRRHVDAGRRPPEIPVQRQEGRTRRHARSAGFGRAAGRLRRGDQDRARSCRTAPRPIGSACAGARRPRPTTPRARSSPAPTSVRAPAEIEAALPRFTGLIEQTPPTFSAIKIDGARAYDLAREGETFEIAARPIHVYRLALVEADARQRRPRGGMRQGRLRARTRPRPRPRARLPWPRDRAPAHAGRAIFGRDGIPARPPAGRRRPDGARHAPAPGRPRRTAVRSRSTATARRSCGAGSRCLCAARTRPKGRPGPPASARRSLSA